MPKKPFVRNLAEMITIRRITGVVMVAIGAFFTFAAIKAVVTAPATVMRIMDAPFVTRGVVDPENEGKTVVLAFDISDVGDATDDELGFTFPYPFVTREVEQLRCTLSNSKWEWVRVRDSDETINSRSFFGDASVGDYQIEGDLLRGLARRKELSPSDFDSQELDSFLDQYDNTSLEIWNDRFYLTNGNSLHFDSFEYDGDDAVRRSYAREEGSIRIHYMGLPREEYSRIVVIGKQQGNWIVEDDRIDTLTAWEDVESTGELARKVAFSLTGGILLVELAACVPLLYFGIGRIRKPY